MFLLCSTDCLQNWARWGSTCSSLLLSTRSHGPAAKTRECSDTGGIQMRSGVLDCTFPRDIECLPLPITDNKAGEDVAGAPVADMWLCSPCLSCIPLLPCPPRHSLSSTTPGTGSELASGGVQMREANGTQLPWEWLPGEAA